MILDSFLESVHRTVLPNGITLLVREDRSSEVVAINTLVKAGYFHEPDEVAGMAHLFEHMFFKGSKHFPGAEEIATHVSRLGGVTNAGTIYDSTNYYFVLPSEAVEKGVEIQADAIRHPLFEPDELVREAEVVIEESNRKFDNPLAVAIERMYATAFTRHRMKRWRIGSNDVLRNIRRDDLVAFFETLYRPENIIVSIVGAVSPDRVVDSVARTFGEIPRGELLKARGPREPSQTAFRFGRSTADVTQTYVAFGWHSPGEGSDHEESLDLLGTVLGSGRYSRLYRGVVRAGGANTVSSWNSVYEDVGMFTILASLDSENVHEVERRVIREVESLRRVGPSAFELQLAKNKIEASFTFALEEVLGQAETLAHFESRGSYLDIGKQLRRTEQTTVEQIREAGEEYLRMENLTLFRHEQTDAKEEGIDCVRTRLEGSISTEAEAPLEIPLPERGTGPGVDHAESAKPVQRFVLNNGATLFVQENPSRPTVSIAVGFIGGRISENSGNAGLTQLMTRSMKRGTTTRSASQLDREIEFLGSRIATILEKDYFGFSIRVLVRHFDAALELLADVILRPSFPEDEIERERQLQKATIQRSLDSSSVRPFQLFFEAFYRNHPYGLPGCGFLSSVEDLTRSSLEESYREHVVADGSVIVVVGDVSGAEIAERMEEKFSCLPRRGAPMGAVPGIEPHTPQEVVETRDRKQTAIVVGFPTVPARHPDWVRLRLLQDVMSGLAGTLFAELRGRRSLCYTVYAGESSRLHAGAFVAYIAAEAAKEVEAREGLLGEFRKLAEEGPAADEVERAKSYLAGVSRIRLQTNGAVASEIMENYFYGLGLDFTERLLESIRLVTADDLREVAKTHLSGDNYTIATLRGSIGREDG